MNMTFQEIVFEFMSSDLMSNINDYWILWWDTFLATANYFIHSKRRPNPAVFHRKFRSFPTIRTLRVWFQIH